MLQPAELHLLPPAFALWHAYDPTLKTELFSTAAQAGDALFLIDPIPLEPASSQKLLKDRRIGGVLLSNAHHLRAGPEFSRRFEVPVFCASAVTAELAGLETVQLDDGSKIAPQISAIELDGATPGEFAFHFASDGGTMVVGDALIHLEPYGFSLLPAKYCQDQRELRRSLGKLLDWPFERLFFAHGLPLLSRGRERLETLLR